MPLGNIGKNGNGKAADTPLVVPSGAPNIPITSVLRLLTPPVSAVVIAEAAALAAVRGALERD